MSTYEVGIIGGGVQGAAIAHHLGRAGVSAALFERATPASGPTGRSSAYCRAGYTNRFLARVALESMEILRDFSAHTGGGDAGFKETGALYLFPPETEGVDDLLSDLRGIGVPIERVTEEQLAAEHPEVANVRGPLAWEERTGYADPAGTTQGFVDDAARNGVDVRLRTPVVELAARGGGGASLTTAAGDVHECEKVVIAAGPWTAPLARQLGVELPLIVERHFVALFSWDDAPRLPYVLSDVDGGYYLMPEGPEQYALGSLLAEEEVDADDYAEEVTTEEALQIAESAIYRVPHLARTSFSGGWASLYDVSPDWQPVIGEIAPGVFVAAGTSGHGFKLAPVLGRHIAGLVTGGAYDRALDQFTHERFEQGREISAGFGAARIIG